MNTPYSQNDAIWNREGVSLWRFLLWIVSSFHFLQYWFIFSLLLFYKSNQKRHPLKPLGLVYALLPQALLFECSNDIILFIDCFFAIFIAMTGILSC